MLYSTVWAIPFNKILKFIQATSCPQLKASTVECGQPAVMMDMPSYFVGAPCFLASHCWSSPVYRKRREHFSTLRDTLSLSVLRESNPGHLLIEPPVLCNWTTTAGQPPTLTILYMHCTGGTNSVRGWLENSLHQERNHGEWFFSL